MTDGDSIAQVAVVVLLLGLAVPALGTAYDYAGASIPYEEDVVVDYGNETSVSENATFEGYSENVTITVGKKTLTQGDDYTWDDDAGNITWYDTSATSDGDDATIEYRAYQRTAQTEAAWSILSPLMGLFGIFGFVAAVRALWSFVAEVWDL